MFWGSSRGVQLFISSPTIAFSAEGFMFDEFELDGIQHCDCFRMFYIFGFRISCAFMALKPTSASINSSFQNYFYMSDEKFE